MRQKFKSIKFSDGVYELPSSMKVKCNVTGRLIHYYVPNLLRIIKNKYQNNYKYFLENYISREGKSMIPSNDTPEQEDDLKEYRNYLLLSYIALKKQPKTSISAFKMDELVEIFNRRFPEMSMSEEVSNIVTSL
jgi:hypothetical protein